MLSTLHPVAANGFNHHADAYARTRPRYPKAALDKIQKLIPNLNASILDLAAGTGILTQLLVDRGYTNVTAVEPVDGMLEKLISLLPEVAAKKGTSWEIPLPSQTQDAVIVAQAWHWFADLNSLKEIHRVLKPNGYFVLLWNMESPRSLWVQGLRNIYERYEKVYRLGGWRAVFTEKEAGELFDLPLNRQQFEYDFLVPKDDIFHRIMTRSFIAILSNEERVAMTKEMEDILDDPSNEFSVNEENQVMYPHDTKMYWTQKCQSS
ncbi:S-adenosyl-L-methionine-dependent methyltransferase [Phascolomyces articulosus]|uniref:S-adenosyl-L-methionine-dependent methyltransferase n=1 Tax=Phascolomyces articulosus TaxID=60185 RepID=A0AAD5KC82_9FUNG|nr:S-adenosyl-L-methionine-dependent methyltransferase [Phascolomyces articulosus]